MTTDTESFKRGLDRLREERSVVRIGKFPTQCRDAQVVPTNSMIL